jgi:linoleoyl-CoA desaturase
MRRGATEREAGHVAAWGTAKMTRLQTRADELEALAELRAQIRREGLDQPTPVLGLAILVFHVVVTLGGMAVFVASDLLWLRAAALLISTYGALGIGMTGHNASHYGVTGSKPVDRALTYLTMTVFNGISATYWRHKHIRLHHSAPNNIGLDSDIDLLPFFALNEDEVRAARGWRRRFYRVQHWLFPFAISLNMTNLQISGLLHLLQDLLHRGHWRSALWADLACVALHVAAFLVLPSLIWPPGSVIGLYLLREALKGYILFAAAAPAHFPPEAKFIKEDGGLLAGQIYTTVNFRTGFFGRLVCLGAEYQIEHHLLPEANPFKMRRVSPIVEAFCCRHHYPYRQLGWVEGVVKSLRIVRQPKPIYRLGDLLGDLR